MDLVAKALYKVTYERIAYEPIRDDFISWYIHAYRELSIGEKLDKNNGELTKMALESRSEALRYEPDDTLSNVVDVTSQIESVVKTVTAISSLIGLSAGALFLWVGTHVPFPAVVSVVSGLTGSILVVVPGSALPLYVILKSTIKTNGELIRLYNKELTVSIGRIKQSERWEERVTAYHIHHSSLCSTTQLPVIVFLGVLRVVSPSIYGVVCHRLKADISEYQEHSFWEMVGREYSRIKDGQIQSRSGSF